MRKIDKASCVGGNKSSDKTKTKMQIQITITDKITDLSSFAPVEGNYEVNATSLEMEDFNPNDVEDAISAELTAKHGFAVKVEIFQSNGYAITGETPSAGDFLATRK